MTISYLNVGLGDFSTMTMPTAQEESLEENNLVGAFFDLDDDGTLENVGVSVIYHGSFSPFAMWGNDASTIEKDGLGSGDIPIFAALIYGSVYLLNPIPQFNGYMQNGTYIFLN